MSQVESQFAQCMRFAFGFDPFSERLNAAFAAQVYESTKKLPLGGWCAIDVSNQSLVKLEIVRRYLDQFVDATVSGAEVVVGKLNVKLAKCAAQFVYYPGVGGRLLVNLECHSFVREFPA